MFNIPAITWTLTAILLLSASYHFLRAVRSHHLTVQANESLHALMNVLMTAMLWNLAPSTMLAQIALLVGAALWFVIQAVARPEFKILCAATQSRIKCVYHAATMAGAALMVAMMGHVTAAGPGIVPADGMSMPMPNEHHATAPTLQSAAAATFGHSPTLPILLTVLFGAAAVTFFVLVLRSRTTTTPRNAATPRRSARAEHGLEALGATIMALMFATMSA